MIVKKILQKFPNDQILTEERSVINKDSQEATWIIDPIDGTVNFAAGLPFFGVSLYVREQNGKEYGRILIPSSKTIYSSATREQSKKDNRPIGVSKTEELRSAVVTVNLTSHYSIKETQETLELINKLASRVRGIMLCLRSLRSSEPDSSPGRNKLIGPN